jgi:hypothetical protein
MYQHLAHTEYSEKHVTVQKTHSGMTSGKSTTGCRSVRSFQLDKWHMLCKMVYSIEEHMFTVKTFYQISSFVRIQRQFLSKWKGNRHQQDLQVLINWYCLWQQKRCGGKAPVSMMHTEQCCSFMQSTALESKKLCDTMFAVTQYQNKINTHHYVMQFDVVSLQNPSGTDFHCSQQVAEMLVLSGYFTFCSAIPHHLRLSVI